MLAGTQQSATSVSAIAACCYEQGALLEKYTPISAVPIPDPRNNFKGSQPRDKSGLRNMHLTIQLVNHPELNKQQLQVILDAISLSTPEFFAASHTTPANKAKADAALESLTRRALGAFTNDQAAQLFANVTDAEQDILKMYYDLSALSLRKRRAAFRNASPNDKSNLWKTHLALFLVKRELSDWQKQVVLSAISLATPAYFAVQSNDPAWNAKVREPSYWLEQQVINAFSLGDAAKIFATLGDDDAKSAKSTASVFLESINYKHRTDSVPYKQWAHSRLSEQDIELERSSCECSTQSDYCPIWSACGGGSCASTGNGCGTLWNYPCNGACR